MLLITLDTSCVSALANPSPTDDPSEVAALKSLVEHFRRGTIRLQVAVAYERDFDRWKDEAGRQKRLEWLESIPVLEQAPGAFRLDVSVLDGPDLLGGPHDVQLDGQLRSFLEPNRRDARSLPSYEEAPGVAGRILSDIDHLIAHKNSGADWFAALDKNILKHQAALSNLGIEVALPTAILVSIKAK